MKDSRADKNRTKLANAIPINTPYVVGFWTGDVCNFKSNIANIHWGGTSIVKINTLFPK